MIVAYRKINLFRKICEDPHCRKDDILEARCAIVFGPNVSWTVDGALSVVEEDGTVTALPEFSDVFPEDWDLAAISAKYNEMTVETTGTQIASVNSVSAYGGANFEGNVSVPKYSSTSQAPVFYAFNGSGAKVQSLVDTTDIDCKVNLGMRNLDTGIEVGWKANMDEDDELTIGTTSGVRYGMRCSSYQKAHKAFITVKDLI